jgi:hypothetical protein
MKKIAGLFLVLNCLFRVEATPNYKVSVPGLEVRLSDSGEVVGMTLGDQIHAVRGRTFLSGCQTVGQVAVNELPGGGIEFSRAVQNVDGRKCQVTERFTPATNSVRWEVKIQSDDVDWSAPVVTTLAWPDSAQAGIWAAWQDPIDPHSMDKVHSLGLPWNDPLMIRSFTNMTWHFGSPANGGFWKGDIVTLPLVSILEPAQDLGLSLVQSPEDTLLEMDLTTTSHGEVSWKRYRHRFGGGNTVRFAMDIVPHSGDWRSAMKWITARYPDYFEPPNPHVQEMAGTAAYTGEEKPVDLARLKRMAFRVDWKLGDDYAYMGMFLPPLSDPDARWVRISDKLDPIGYKPQWTSFRRLNDFAHYSRTNGLFLLNYFNTTEFGINLSNVTVTPEQARNPDLWKDASAYLQVRMPDAPVKPRKGVWQGGWLVDSGDPAYKNYLLEQAQRHLTMIPDAAGFCIDRADHLFLYNTNADDGVTWRNGHRARALVVSWKELLDQLGPLVHNDGKVIFCNFMDPRLDLARQLDGVYDESGYRPPVLNGVALLCVDKPLLLWTQNNTPLSDDFFQRCLYLGGFPTAPYPLNNHCIQPSPEHDRWYLDYGPLLDLMRGKQWVFESHCVEVVNQAAKVNLFRVDVGWVAPVTFGGSRTNVTLRIGHVEGLKKGIRCEALHPGESEPVPIPAVWNNGELELQVPLKRGCAMVSLK